MKLIKYLFTIIISLFAMNAVAAGSSAPIALDHVRINLNDKAAIMAGAKFFKTYCVACHAMKYLRYDKLAQKAGLTYDSMPVNIKEWSFGAPPPDLSLSARVRGSDWLYTYFHSFYQDKKQATGFNNLLVKNSSMPNVFFPMQGEQVLLPEAEQQKSNPMFTKPHWYNKLVLVKQGSMTPAQFNEAMKNLVTFMAYASEPHRAQQERIGWWVLGFLVIFFILAYLLKREYWKDVK